MASTFMRDLYDAVEKAVEQEPAKSTLAGISKAQVVSVVKTVTAALDEMPPETSLHTVLFGLTYIRNAVLVAMEANQKRMEDAGGLPT